MRRRIYLRQVVAAVMSLVLTAALIPEFAFAESQLVTEDNVTEEDVTEKTETTTSYELTNGEKMTVFYPDDVRFKDDNGVLIDYDPELKEITEEKSSEGVPLDGYAYKNNQGDSDQYIPVNLSENTPIFLEKGEFSASISPTETMLSSNGITGSVETGTSRVENPYESSEKKLVDAEYQGSKASILYTSENKGVKETFILKEKPTENVFTYRLKLNNMIARKDATGGITFFNESDPDEIKGGIAPAFMNDAGGNAYSEDINYDIKEVTSEEESREPEETTAEEEMSENDEEDDGDESGDGSSEAADSSLETREAVTDADTEDTYSASEQEENITAAAEETAVLQDSYTHEYMITMTVSKEYLESSEREYPVKIDPSLSWTGSAKVQDAYVISGSKYSGTNFYSSSVKKMPTGYNSTGKHRTYVKFVSLASSIKNKRVTGATLSVYDYGEGTSGQNVYVRRITSSWSPSKVKWNNKPSHAAIMDTVKVTKTKYKKYNFNVLTYAKYVAGGGTDYGLGLMHDAAKYTSFFGSRSSSYKPKLTITYVDKPPTPSAVTLNKTNAKPGEDLVVTYSFPSTSGVSKVMCAIEKRNNSGKWDTISGAKTITQKYHLPRLDEGVYRLYIYAQNSVGDKGTGKYSSNIVIDGQSPVIGDAYISTQKHDKLGSTWTDESDFTINFSGISDESPNNSAPYIGYAITEYDYKRDTQKVPPATAFKTGNITKSAASPYSGQIIADDSDKALPGGDYAVFIKAKDAAGNEVVKCMRFRKDVSDPTGSISIFSTTGSGQEITGEDLQNLSGIVTIKAELDGTGSALKNTAVKINIKNGEETEYIENISGTITKDTAFDIDTREYVNGDYTLSLSLEDQIGKQANVSKDIGIRNPLPAPAAEAVQDGTKLKLSCSYGDNESHIVSSEYRMNGGQWQTIPENRSIENVPEGNGTLDIRGIDDFGIKTEATTVTYVMDTEPPQAEIVSFLRGVMVFKAEDVNLDKWGIKYKGAGEEDYTDTGIEGTTSYSEEHPGKVVLNIADLGLEAGNVYTFKLEVYDKAGHVTSDTASLTYDPSAGYVREIKAQFRVERPSYYRENDYKDTRFIVPKKQDSFTIKDTDSIPDDAVIKWHIGNTSAGTGRTLEYDCAELTDKTAKEIIASYTEGGDRKYSSKVVENDAISSIEFAANETKTADANGKAIVSFTVRSINGVVSYIKSDGTSTQLTAGTRYYISDLGSTCYKEELNFESEGMGSMEIAMDTIEPEEFEVSELSEFVPENASVKSNLNGRTYLYWNGDLGNEENISYNVYHSKQENFVLGEDTLAAEKVKSEYYCELNQGYSETYYYAVTVVKRNTNGDVIDESPARRCDGYMVDEDETTKRLGEREYYSYTEFPVSCGTALIEESQGNLLYSQTDGDIPDDSIELEAARAYNSRSTAKGAFGYGWTGSFNLELINLYDTDSKDFKNLIFRDGSGAITRFVQKSDGSYASKDGEYLTLKKEEREITKGEGNNATIVTSAYTIKENDGTEYLFNSGGQAVCIISPDGGKAFFSYDSDNGVLKKVEADTGRSIEYVYGGEGDQETAVGNSDMLLVSSALMPDGSTREYEYNDGYLTKVTAASESETGNSISWTYEYGEGGEGQKNLTKIHDGENNSYTASYDSDSDRIIKIENPCGEGVKFSYGGAGSETNTEIESYYDKGLLYAEKTVNRVTGTYSRSTGIPKKKTDIDGVVTSFSFVDGMPTETSYQIEGYSLTDGRVVSTGVAQKVETAEYGRYRNLVSSTDTDGIETEYSYDENDNIKDLVKNEVIRDSNGQLIESYISEYDNKGNEVSRYDAVDNRTVIMTYDAKGDLTSEKEYEGEGSEGSLISSTTYSIETGSNGNKTEVVTDVVDGVTTVMTTVKDGLDREISKTVKTGDVTDESRTYVYDGLGRLTTQTLTEEGRTTSVTTEYDNNDNVISENTVTTKGSESETLRIEYTYDKCGRVINAKTYDNGELTEVITTYEYTDIEAFDGEGGKQTIEDAFTVTEIDEDAHVISQECTDRRGLTVRSKQNGIYEDVYYDKYGTAMSTCVYGDSLANTDVQVTLIVTDSNGNVTAAVNNPASENREYYAGEESIVTKSDYDAQNRVIKNTDPSGNETSYTYNSKGELASVICPGNVTTSFNYSEEKKDGIFENKVQTTHPNGLKSDVVTDEYGNTVRIKDFFTPEDAGEAESRTTVFSYTDGNLSKVSKEKGNFCRFEYDSTTGNVNKVKYYDEDNAGEAGLVYETEYTYNMNSNVTMQKDYEISGTAKTLVSAKKMTYNGQGRLASESVVIDKQNPTTDDYEAAKISYSYDKKGNVTGIDYAFKDGKASGLIYEYDSDNRITKVKAKNGVVGSDTVREYAYDTFGRVSEIKDYYGFSAISGKYLLKIYGYDNMNRLSYITIKDSGDDEIKEAYLYKYDKNGYIIEEQSMSEYTGDGGTKYKREYEYDELGHLTKSTTTDEGEGMIEVSDENGDPGVTVTEYSYDDMGNRILKKEGDIRTLYTYGSFNELIHSETRSGEEVSSSKHYLYDDNGNRTGEYDSVTATMESMTYNAMDMMSGYQRRENGEIVLQQRNIYDGEGKRIIKEEVKPKEEAGIDLNSGESTAQGDLEKTLKKYRYQGNTVVETAISKTDISGYAEIEGVRQSEQTLTEGLWEGYTANPIESGSSTTSRMFNLLTPGSNIIAASKTKDGSENWYTYNSDYQGSVSSMVSETGDPVSTYEYDDYGNITESTDSIDNEVCYTGQIYDENTGLYYYNARYYDSQNACFTTMDTYRGENSIPITLNLYMYCAGNPINFTDPTGNSFLKKLLKLFKPIKKKGKNKYKVAKKPQAVKSSRGEQRRKGAERARIAGVKIKKRIKKSIHITANKKDVMSIIRKNSVNTGIKATAQKSLKDKTYRDAKRSGKLSIETEKIGEVKGKVAGKALGVATVIVDTGMGIIKNRKNGVGWKRTITDAVVDAGFGTGTLIAAGFLTSVAVGFFGGGAVAMLIGGAIVGSLISMAVSAVRINGKSIKRRAKEGLYGIT